MKSLDKQIDSLESLIPKYSFINDAISKGSVGWHIEHSFLTIRRIISGVKSSDPANYKGRYKALRIVVLIFGIIPRGKVTSPKVVTPDPDINNETLMDSLMKARVAIKELDAILKNQHFEHPVLGVLNKRPTIRFLEVHTAHHLKIIKEILG